jgi:hypothetical protein
MSRRIIPGTFWAGILLSVVLVLADSVWASRPSDGVPNLVGQWDGFFQEADTKELGHVRSDINAQVQQRIKAHGMLFDPQGELLTPYELSAMVSDDNFITGMGNSPMGGVAYDAVFETFAGDVGDAGVQLARYQFSPRRSPPIVADATLLRPFPDADAPDISGIGTGTFVSTSNTSTFGGSLLVTIAPRDHRGAFPGQAMFMNESGGDFPSLSWDLRATISGPNHFITPSGANRFVMIAQGGIGRLVADGVSLPMTGGNARRFIGGRYSLQLIDGRTDFGAYNFTLLR